MPFAIGGGGSLGAGIPMRSPAMGGPGPAQPGNFKHGGKVKKTGLAKVERGEKVLTKKQQKMEHGKKGMK